MESYGYRRGFYFIVTASGLKCSYHSKERFRYALRNEHNIPTKDADRIVEECKGK